MDFRAERPTLAKYLSGAIATCLGLLDRVIVHLIPGYAALLRRSSRSIDLMVICADNADAERVRDLLAGQGPLGVSVLEQPYRLDADHALDLRRYLRQLDNLPAGSRTVATAVGSGLLTGGRVRVIQRLFPDLRLAFLARNPMAHAWRNAQASTGPSTRALFAALSRPQSRRRADQSRSLAACAAILGADRLRVLPAELLESNARALSEELAALARRDALVHGAPSAIGEAPLEGLQDSLRSLLLRDYGPLAREFGALAQSVDRRYDWTGMAAGWVENTRNSPLPSEAKRTLQVICGFRPSSRATSSGQKLAQQRIVQLARRFARVDVICFVNQLDRLDAGSASEAWPENVGVLEVKLTLLHRIAGMLRWPAQPVFAASRRMAVHSLLGDGYVEHTDFFADFSQGLGAVPGSDYGLFAFRQHDIVSRLYERKAAATGGPRRLANRIEAWRARRWEARAWNSALRVETISADDAAYVIGRHPRAEVFNGGATSTIRVDASERRSEAIVPGRLIYWGNMSRAENVDAAAHMSRILLPRIRERVPHAHLWIVGAHPTAEVRALASDIIHVTGFVEDPALAFHSAAAAVAPLRLGSGVKIKVLETIDAGIPTIVSPVAGEGIPPHRLLLEAQTDEDFVDLVCRVLLAG